MRNYDKLISLANQNNGYVFAKDATKYSIPRNYLAFATNDGVIEKVSSGIYVLPDVFPDNLFVFQRTNTKVVYSAFTSAYLHNLTTRDNEVIFGSVPRDYNSRKVFSGNVIAREYHNIYNLGLLSVKTMYGNYVVCHDIHRTVCDLFCDKFIGDKFVQIEVLKNYLGRKDKDLTKLMRYAKQIGVDEQLRDKLEVLV